MKPLVDGLDYPEAEPELVEAEMADLHRHWCEWCLAWWQHVDIELEQCEGSGFDRPDLECPEHRHYRKEEL